MGDVFEGYRCASGSAMVPSTYKQKNLVLDDDAELIWVYESPMSGKAAWEDAMTRWYQFMGYETYVPFEG